LKYGQTGTYGKHHISGGYLTAICGVSIDYSTLTDRKPSDPDLCRNCKRSWYDGPKEGQEA
jgi:hypothetical protein